jgi:hypothetical protein
MNEITIKDPDKEIIDRLYPLAMKVGDPFKSENGRMKGNGHCIRREFTKREGILFTILYDDGSIREHEWFD